MKMYVPKAMVEPFDINIMTKLWVTINNNDLITQQLSEYLKLVEIVMMSMLRFTKDEWTFSTLAFMRNKLHNWLGSIWMQLFACLHKSFIFNIPSFIKRLLPCLVVPLNKFYSSHKPSLKCSCFHDVDKYNELRLCLVPYEVYWHLGVMDETLSLHWTKSDIRVGFNSPSKYLC
jgi:hypothetical protein